MAENKFGAESELVVGDVYGVRHFKLTEAGELTGVIYPAVIEPGVNEAVCYSGAMAQEAARRLRRQPGDFTAPVLRSLALGTASYGETMKAYSDAHGGLAPRLADVPGHNMATCTCGFYAYFSEGQERFFDDQVGAVVRASGRTLVGTLGFRAQRVEPVAVWPTQPDPSWLTRQTARLYPRYDFFEARREGLTGRQVIALLAVLAVLLGIPVAAALTDLLEGWRWGILMVICYSGFAWINGLTQRFNSARFRRSHTRGGPLFTSFERFKRQVGARYPGVLVYRTRDEALRFNPTSQARDFDY